MFRILFTLMVRRAGTGHSGHDAGQDAKQLRREIGVVFQARAYDLKLTAAENLWHQDISMACEGRRCLAGSKKFSTAVGLTDRARDKAETFSGGMQRRLSSPRGCYTASCSFWLDRADYRPRPRERAWTSGSIFGFSVTSEAGHSCWSPLT